MKKMKSILLVAMLSKSMVACAQTPTSSATIAQTNEPETIEITALNGNKEETQVTVPYNPERIAILDMAALDIIDDLGMGDKVVGSATTSIDYLQDYVEDEDIINLGTIKEADLEAVMECEPDVIFIGGRLSASYDALNEIAPVVFLSTDSEIGLVESVKKNATTIASMFGLEDEVDEKMENFDTRISTLQEVANGKTALVGMTTSGSFNLLGNDGRCSIIGNEIGFENLTGDTTESGRGGSENRGSSSSEGQGENAGNSPHGNEASFETVVAQNPDYIFVMDRDSAIGTEGAQLAQEIMENELVQGTDAYKNGNIVYLAHPAVWYTAEGGIQALDVMVQDLEAELL